MEIGAVSGVPTHWEMVRCSAEAGETAVAGAERASAASKAAQARERQGDTLSSSRAALCVAALVRRSVDQDVSAEATDSFPGCCLLGQVSRCQKYPSAWDVRCL